MDSLERHKRSPNVSARNLLLGGGLGEVGEGLTALELGVLDDTWRTHVVSISCQSFVVFEKFHDLPASASLEKLPVYSTKVEPSRSPLVTA